MKRFYLPFFLLLIIVIEGVALDFLPTSFFAEEWVIVPHWLLVFLVMIALFYDFEHSYYSILYAILFGLMVDIVYTSVIGVYMFIYALVIYIIHGLRKVLHTNYFVALLLSGVGVLLADTGLYVIYFFIGISEMQWNVYLLDRLLPTLLANVLFFLLLYPLVKGKLIKWSQHRFDSKNS